MQKEHADGQFVCGNGGCKKKFHTKKKLDNHLELCGGPNSVCATCAEAANTGDDTSALGGVKGAQRQQKTTCTTAALRTDSDCDCPPASRAALTANKRADE